MEKKDEKKKLKELDKMTFMEKEKFLHKICRYNILGYKDEVLIDDTDNPKLIKIDKQAQDLIYENRTGKILNNNYKEYFADNTKDYKVETYDSYQDLYKERVEGRIKTELMSYAVTDFKAGEPWKFYLSIDELQSLGLSHFVENILEGKTKEAFNNQAIDEEEDEWLTPSKY